MKPKFDLEKVKEFCRQRGISRLELFGSSLRDDVRAESDVDLLATVRPGVKCGLFEWIEIREGFEKIFNRPVDLVSRRAIERSNNPYRRNAILGHTEPLYVEG